MRKRYVWSILAVVLLVTMVSGGIHAALANEINATRSNATPSDASPSNASPSDALPGQDAGADEFVLLMDLPDEGCGSQAELVEQLLDDGQDRIVLSSDIRWMDNMSLSVSGEKVVEMGEYRILIEDGYTFAVKGDVIFTGSGSRGSLFKVQGYFEAGDGVTISAEGDHAVALETDGGNLGSGQVKIYAAGTGARAVRFTGSGRNDVFFCKIEAAGEGSLGIDSEGELRICLSSVSGEEAAAVSRSGRLINFGSRLSPEPDYEERIQVLSVPYNRMEENGICVAVGSAQEELMERLEAYEKLTWRFFSEQTSLNQLYLSSVDWSGIPEDFSRPDTWIARCEPSSVPEWFPEEVCRLEVPIHVVDPKRPFIMDAEDAGSAVLLRFFSPVRDAEEIRVEYSADNKKSWRDAAELSDSFVSERLASVEPLQPGQDYWFRLIVQGGPMEGVSNEILFVGDQVKKANGGGDRDHGDRDDQGEQPPQGEIIPPPDGSRPGDPKPDNSRPNDSRPDDSRPDDSRPDDSRPGDSRPDDSRPDNRPAYGAEPGDTDTADPDKDNITAGEKQADNAAADGAIPDGAIPDETMPDETIPENTTAGTLPLNLPGPGEPDSGDKTSAMPQEPVRNPDTGVSGWGSVLCIILLGGGSYACWKRWKKKRKGKH